MNRLKQWVAWAGGKPPWIVALLVAAVAALRASDQYGLALLCLAAATILLSAKIVDSAISHEPHSTIRRGVFASIGAISVIAIAIAIGIGLRPRTELAARRFKPIANHWSADARHAALHRVGTATPGGLSKADY